MRPRRRPRSRDDQDGDGWSTRPNCAARTSQATATVTPTPATATATTGTTLTTASTGTPTSDRDGDGNGDACDMDRDGDTSTTRTTTATMSRTPTSPTSIATAPATSATRRRVVPTRTATASPVDDACPDVRDAPTGVPRPLLRPRRRRLRMATPGRTALTPAPPGRGHERRLPARPGRLALDQGAQARQQALGNCDRRDHPARDADDHGRAQEGPPLGAGRAPDARELRQPRDVQGLAPQARYASRAGLDLQRRRQRHLGLEDLPRPLDIRAPPPAAAMRRLHEGMLKHLSPAADNRSSWVVDRSCSRCSYSRWSRAWPPRTPPRRSSSSATRA